MQRTPRNYKRKKHKKQKKKRETSVLELKPSQQKFEEAHVNLGGCIVGGAGPLLAITLEVLERGHHGGAGAEQGPRRKYPAQRRARRHIRVARQHAHSASEPAAAFLGLAKKRYDGILRFASEVDHCR